MRKEAKLAIGKRLLDDQQRIRSKLRQNLGTMKSLVAEQTQLKRELAVLQELIRYLQPK